MSLQVRETDIGEIFAIRTSVAENHLSLEQLAKMGITPEANAAMLTQGPCLWIAEIDRVPAGFSIVRDETACVFGLFARAGHEVEVWAAYFSRVPSLYVLRECRLASR
ncbi:hypothetical protein [Salinicola halophyticus]|uniref:hypothetical protein n=1 Tax=Salinicola halophyticus TaxID=1808881 RepID=UPI000DA1EA09|nr:hypothetical protein [Salinicola halophyticus]